MNASRDNQLPTDMSEVLIKLGGFYNILLIVFHLLFWRIFDWRSDLQSLTFINRAIMQVVNLSLTLVFVLFACVSLLYTDALLTTALGHALLVGMALFWLARALLQVVFFKLKHPVSVAFLLYFLAGAVLYGIPAMTLI